MEENVFRSVPIRNSKRAHSTTILCKSGVNSYSVKKGSGLSRKMDRKTYLKIYLQQYHFIQDHHEKTVITATYIGSGN